MITYNTYYTSSKDLAKYIEANAIYNSAKVLVQVFTANTSRQQIERLIREIKELLPGCVIIGATTDGEIMDGRVTVEHTVLSFTVFEQITPKSCLIAHRENSFATGTALAQAIISNDTKILITFTDGMHTNGEEYLRGIDSYDANIIVAGGLAGDNSTFTGTYVFNEQEVISSGAVAVALNGSALHIHTRYSFNWQPIGKEMTITKVKHNRVYTIDNKTAYETYDHYLGGDIAARLPRTAIEFPLIIQRDGIDIARAVLDKRDDGSLIFAGDLHQGDRVRFGHGNADMILETSKNELISLNKKPIESIFVYSCMGRRRFMPNLIDQEIKPLLALAPVSGFFTYGEFYTDKQKTLLNETMTILALSESNEEKHIMVSDPEIFPEQSEELETVRAFAHLVNVTSKEVDMFTLAWSQSNNSIVITDSEGKIEYANQAVFDITGYSLHELIGQAPGILNSGFHPDSFFKEMWNTIKTGNIWRGKVCNKRKNGTLFWEDVTISPITNYDNEISNYLAIKIDITREMEMEKQLRESLSEAQSATLAKSEFLANMSHEIRTPMNGVIGMTRLALDTSLNKKQKQYLNNVMVSATGLLDLLNDILDISKIEAKQLTLENRNFSLRALQENSISNMQVVAEEKGLIVEDRTNFSVVPGCVVGDELRIRQIVTNLLSNAVKFTKKGRVSLETTILHNQKDDKTIDLKFCVSDTGIGIPIKKLQTIFVNFSQADASTSRQYGGTGLGLAISHQLVKLMGGNLEVDSTEGKGSTFHFTIPLRPGHEIKTVSETMNDRKNFNLRVLLVEDNHINQEIARIILENLGCTVKIADNGLAALFLLAENSFDVLLMDVQMPVLDGLCTCHYIRTLEDDPSRNCHKVCVKRTKEELKTAGCYAAQLVTPELAEKLKKNLQGRHHYIIAMTANAMTGDKEKCLAVGMDDYLTKPYMPEDILAILDRLNVHPVKEKNVNQPLPLINTPDPVSLKEQSVTHLQRTYNLTDAQVELFLVKSAEAFAKDLARFNKKLKKPDLQGIQEAAHKIKGGLLNLGLDEMVAQAQKIEMTAKSATTPLDPEMIADLTKAITSLIINISASD